MRMTLRDALTIQARQIEYYAGNGILTPEARAKIEAGTDVSGCDIDALIDIVEVNRRVPRGCSIEWACGIDTSGE